MAAAAAQPQWFDKAAADGGTQPLRSTPAQIAAIIETSRSIARPDVKVWLFG